MNIRVFCEEDRAACAELLAGLPEWFGIEASNRAYVAALGTLPTAVAEMEGRCVGFVALERPYPETADVHVLAADRDRHRLGIGTALLQWAVDSARADGARWLRVVTRGPATPDEHYARTRAFYRARGFDPVIESTTHWGPDDAALILVHPLTGDAP